MSTRMEQQENEQGLFINRSVCLQNNELFSYRINDECD